MKRTEAISGAMFPRGRIMPLERIVSDGVLAAAVRHNDAVEAIGDGVDRAGYIAMHKDWAKGMAATAYDSASGNALPVGRKLTVFDGIKHGLYANAGAAYTEEFLDRLAEENPPMGEGWRSHEQFLADRWRKVSGGER